MNFWDRLMNVDRRIIYGLAIILIGAVIVYPLGLPVTVSDTVQDWYDLIESLPEDGVLWLDVAYSANTLEELGPMTEAVLYHAFSRGLKVCLMTSWNQGPPMIKRALDKVLPEFPDLEYGVDFVNFGYRAGEANVVFPRLARSTYETFEGVDNSGKSLDQFPLAMQVKAVTPEYVDLLIVFETGNPGGPQWVQYVGEPAGTDIANGIIAMSVPGALNYLQAGQYKAILPGSRGCAEYESLIGRPGNALAGQDALSIGMLLVTLMIVLGNIGWVMRERSRA